MSNHSFQDSIAQIPQAGHLKGHTADLERLAATRDGKAVEEMLSRNSSELSRAFQNGDTAAMQRAVREILKTDAGARVMEELEKLLR